MATSCAAGRSLRAGKHDEGIAEIERGLALSAETGARMDEPYYLVLLADAQYRAGRFDDAAETIAKALELADRGRRYFYEAELHRLDGEILLAGHDRQPEAAAASFSRAMRPRAGQGTPALEVRAALSAGRARRGRRSRGGGASAGRQPPSPPRPDTSIRPNWSTRVGSWRAWTAR